MKIYQYNQQETPRPACVEDGGYLYDAAAETVVGFGTDDSELEITVDEARAVYDEIMGKADEPDPRTADEFLADNGVEV